MSSGRLLIGLSILLGLATACTPGPAASTPAAGGAVTPSPVATTPAPVTPSYVQCTPGVTTLPTTTPPPAGVPSFSHTIYFSQTPDPSQAGYLFYQYPPGIRTIYAIWTYSNMAAGLQVRWDLNQYGTRWLSSQIPWDFARCGAEGTLVEQVASDPTNGLSAGVYDLDLYIDDQPQFMAQDDPAARGFEILPAGT